MGVKLHVFSITGAKILFYENKYSPDSVYLCIRVPQPLHRNKYTQFEHRKEN